MQELFKAITANDFPRFRSLLNSSPDIANQKSEHGVSTILFAIYHGKPEYADELVKAGAMVGIHEAAALGDMQKIREILDDDTEKVNSFSEDGFQPLGLAAFFGHVEVGEYLLAHGADPAMPSHNEQMVAPIHSAVAGRSRRIVSALLKKGVDINAKQQGGYTALHASIHNKDFDTVTLLVQNGADCNATNDRGERPIDLADDESREVIASLLKECK